jgi:hypothetical protein
VSSVSPKKSEDQKVNPAPHRPRNINTVALGFFRFWNFTRRVEGMNPHHVICRESEI